VASSDKTQYLSEDSTLAIYLKEIGKHRTLSAEEEAAAAVGIRKGDRSALDRLVKANLRFVVSVARNYQNQGLPLSDLINEGNLGLIRAAKRFDEGKNFKFISYAVWWIRQAILQALAEQSRIVKLPLNRVGTIHKIGKAQARLEQKYRRMPNPEELARELSLSVEDVRQTVKISNTHMSLDAPVQTGNEYRMLDMLTYDDQEDPDENVEETSLREQVRRTLDALSERERDVVMMYFGINDDTDHTLEEIGKRFNLTRERARQIKEKAINRLKKTVKARSLVTFGS
jgi:RNA polymerase primary sigma factor